MADADTKLTRILIISSGCSSATTAATRSTKPSSRSAVASSASGGFSAQCDSSSDMEQKVKGPALG
jgi:hypothetical protein